MWNTRLSELEFDGDELAGALEAIESGWITAGPRTKAFEQAFADAAGTEDAVAVSNGTAALFLALKGLGIGPGDEVLVPSMTFVATAAAVLHCGAKPVFVDITSLEDPTMDPADAARKVGPFTRAILPVHYAGIPCDMTSLATLARSKNLLVVEDAAHAPGAVYKGRPCGKSRHCGLLQPLREQEHHNGRRRRRHDQRSTPGRPPSPVAFPRNDNQQLGPGQRSSRTLRRHRVGFQFPFRRHSGRPWVGPTSKTEYDKQQAIPNRRQVQRPTLSNASGSRPSIPVTTSRHRPVLSHLSYCAAEQGRTRCT